MIKRADIFFVVSAFVAFLLTNYLWFFAGDFKAGLFVVLWVPSNLVLALYFKIIKLDTNTEKK